MKNEIVYAKYGTLFEEFATDRGVSTLLFYPYFFLRRFCYAVILYNLGSVPWMQVFLNCVHTLIVIVYISKFKPFANKNLNYFNLFQEVCILTVFILCGFFIQNNSSIVENILQYTVMGIVGLSIFLGYIYAIYDGIRGAIERYRKANQISIRVMRSNTVVIKPESRRIVPVECDVSVIDNSLREEETSIMNQRHFDSPRLSKKPSSSVIFEIEIET